MVQMKLDYGWLLIAFNQSKIWAKKILEADMVFRKEKKTTKKKPYLGTLIFPHTGFEQALFLIIIFMEATGKILNGVQILIIF